VAAAAVNLARTSYLPRVDFLGQLNRATRNNVYGMLLPQATVPPISGPPLPDNKLTNVWGTAVGMLVSWEPFDFGLRQAGVDTAASARKRADRALESTRFEVAATAADAFLTLLAAERAAEAAAASLQRAKIFHEVVDALARAQLRPGADAARARAEMAAAGTQLIQAEQAAAVARASLGQLLAVPSGSIRAEEGPLSGLPTETGAEAAATVDHPLIREQSAAIDEAKARLNVLERSYYPRFNLQAAIYGRGTGANPDFTTGGAAAGLGPNVHNWGIGMSVTLPLAELAAIRAKKEIETHRERAETARQAQLMQELASRLEKAQAALEGARRVAGNTPVQLEAARAALDQATARYKSGLGNVLEVAEAQRLLTQAEIDDALARLNVWRAALGVAAAQGDLGPFLRQAAR